MLATVLHSPVFIQTSIEVMRTFVRLRRAAEWHGDWLDAHGVRNLFDLISDVKASLPAQPSFRTARWTYFLQAGEVGPIKIGSTRNLTARLDALTNMSPVPLRLLGLIRGGKAERLCHARFAAFRLHGKWFVPESPIIRFIREHTISPHAFVLSQ